MENRGKSQKIIEHNRKIIDNRGKSWKIMEIMISVKTIAGSEEFGYRILRQPSHRQLHLVLPWGRRERHSPCHGPESVLVNGPTHQPKKGPEKWPVNHQKYPSNTNKWSARKMKWILGLQIFRHRAVTWCFCGLNWINHDWHLSTSILTFYHIHYSLQYLQWFGSCYVDPAWSDGLKVDLIHCSMIDQKSMLVVQWNHCKQDFFSSTLQGTFSLFQVNTILNLSNFGRYLVMVQMKHLSQIISTPISGL